MNIDESYMHRCLQLAALGRGFVSPNPMVGAVVVHNGLIIGEGYHRKYGEPHAEVNAIRSVKDKSWLKESTIYVSLEPCSHHGKTPPCSQLIIDSGIPRVVVATTDPFPQVSGRGIKMLRDAGIDVELGILESKALELNKEFFCRQINHRPYVYLKWAQTRDGFIDKERNENEPKTPTPISNDFTKMLVHKSRTEIAAIMIGTNTAIMDNPHLTSRLWYGKNPLRIVLDRTLRIPKDNHLFKDGGRTLIFTENDSINISGYSSNVEFIAVKFDLDIISNILSELNNRKIGSILIEGGKTLLQEFIDKKVWDEAFIEIANFHFYRGVPAPIIDGDTVSNEVWNGANLVHIKKQTNP